MNGPGSPHAFVMAGRLSRNRLNARSRSTFLAPLDEGRYKSGEDRTPPSKANKIEIVRQIERMWRVRDLVDGINLSPLPAGRTGGEAKTGELGELSAVGQL